MKKNLTKKTTVVKAMSLGLAASMVASPLTSLAAADDQDANDEDTLETASNDFDEIDKQIDGTEDVNGTTADTLDAIDSANTVATEVKDNNDSTDEMINKAEAVEDSINDADEEGNTADAEDYITDAQNKLTSEADDDITSAKEASEDFEASKEDMKEAGTDMDAASEEISDAVNDVNEAIANSEEALANAETEEECEEVYEDVLGKYNDAVQTLTDKKAEYESAVAKYDEAYTSLQDALEAYNAVVGSEDGEGLAETDVNNAVANLARVMASLKELEAETQANQDAYNEITTSKKMIDLKALLEGYEATLLEEIDNASVYENNGGSATLLLDALTNFQTYEKLSKNTKADYEAAEAAVSQAEALKNSYKAAIELADAEKSGKNSDSYFEALLKNYYMPLIKAETLDSVTFVAASQYSDAYYSVVSFDADGNKLTRKLYYTVENGNINILDMKESTIELTQDVAYKAYKVDGKDVFVSIAEFEKMVAAGEIIKSNNSYYFVGAKAADALNKEGDVTFAIVNGQLVVTTTTTSTEQYSNTSKAYATAEEAKKAYEAEAKSISADENNTITSDIKTAVDTVVENGVEVVYNIVYNLKLDISGLTYKAYNNTFNLDKFESTFGWSDKLKDAGFNIIESKLSGANVERTKNNFLFADDYKVSSGTVEYAITQVSSTSIDKSTWDVFINWITGKGNADDISKIDDVNKGAVLYSDEWFNWSFSTTDISYLQGYSATGLTKEAALANANANIDKTEAAMKTSIIKTLGIEASMVKSVDGQAVKLSSKDKKVSSSTNVTTSNAKVGAYKYTISYDKTIIDSNDERFAASNVTDTTKTEKTGETRTDYKQAGGALQYEESRDEGLGIFTGIGETVENYYNAITGIDSLYKDENGSRKVSNYDAMLSNIKAAEDKVAKAQAEVDNLNMMIKDLQGKLQTEDTKLLLTVLNDNYDIAKKNYEKAVKDLDDARGLLDELKKNVDDKKEDIKKAAEEAAKKAAEEAAKEAAKEANNKADIADNIEIPTIILPSEVTPAAPVVDTPAAQAPAVQTPAAPVQVAPVAQAPAAPVQVAPAAQAPAANVVIEDEEVPLAAIDEDDNTLEIDDTNDNENTEITFIDEAEVPEGIVDEDEKQQVSWWWILLAALIAGGSYATYKKLSKKDNDN